MLTPELAGELARVALGHAKREYPNKLDHVLTGPDDLKSPQALHPIFFGSFDWHSCVHGYWLLARLLRRNPTLPELDRIRTLFSNAFTHDNVAAEVGYLGTAFSGTFERPYGWGWLLMLAAELTKLEQVDARGWSITLKPLAQAFSQRFLNFLAKATYPVRTGVHSSTAFALAQVLEYAMECGDEALGAMATRTARRWYCADIDCQAWEPSGEDFLSPALIEAECMRRALPARGVRRLVRLLPPRIGTKRASRVVPAGNSQRPARRQDCAPGWSEFKSRLVLEQPGGFARSIGSTRSNHARRCGPASGSWRAAYFRRLYG